MSNQLTGVFRNIELAIIEALNILSQSSEQEDKAVRSRDLYNFVKNSTINSTEKDDKSQLAMTKFTSALSGKKSSQKLFEKCIIEGRTGSWWRLKMSYNESVQYATQLKSKDLNPNLYYEDIYKEDKIIYKNLSWGANTN